MNSLMEEIKKEYFSKLSELWVSPNTMWKFIESKLESYASKRAEARVLEFVSEVISEKYDVIHNTIGETTLEELAKQFNLKGKE